MSYGVYSVILFDEFRIQNTYIGQIVQWIRECISCCILCQTDFYNNSSHFVQSAVWFVQHAG